MHTAPVARSPITPAHNVTGDPSVTDPSVTDPSVTDPILTDCSLDAKVQVRAAPDGAVAARLDVPSGHAARDKHGTLIVGSGPGEWLLIADPGEGPRLLAFAEELAGQLAAETAAELVTAVDLSHGRALIRITGERSPDVLATLCGINLAPRPHGSALRSSVAALATDIIRDDNDTRSYLLHCERSNGQYLFDMLQRSIIQLAPVKEALR